MGQRLNAADLTVVAPTGIEYLAAQIAIRNHTVVRSGIGQQASAIDMGNAAVICGLAGGLSPELKPGTVVIAKSVSEGGDWPIECHSGLVQAFTAGARRLGFSPVEVRLLGSDHIVTGKERASWFSRGFDAVDMESNHWLKREGPVAVVRVVLDTTEHGLDPAWLNPVRALTRPRLWGQLAWMTVYAPLFALRAARVVAAGLGVLGAEVAQP